MKLTKEKKQVIAKSQKISSIISDKLKKNDGESQKVDLSKIAKGLAERREKAQKEDE